MNIPEITNEVKQGLRSENAVPADAAETTVYNSAARQKPDVVEKQDATQGDKQSHNFSKEELNALIQEAEEHLENNDVKLKFNLIEENDEVQVEIIDADGKTIRKIPDDDLIKLSKSLKNLESGILDQVS